MSSHGSCRGNLGAHREIIFVLFFFIFACASSPAALPNIPRIIDPSRVISILNPSSPVTRDSIADGSRPDASHYRLGRLPFFFNLSPHWHLGDESFGRHINTRIAALWAVAMFGTKGRRKSITVPRSDRKT